MGNNEGLNVSDPGGTCHFGWVGKNLEMVLENDAILAEVVDWAAQWGSV